MPTEISWVNLIAPIETHRFEDEYFGRRVLHQRRALVSPTGLEEITQWREALRGQSLTREGHRGRVVIDPSVRANTTLDGEIDREIDDLLSQGGPLIVDSINKIESDKVQSEVVHSGVGSISESDATLASASDAVILGFHAKIDTGVGEVAKREGVQIKLYAIIYELIEEVKEAMAGLLDPLMKDVVTGQAEVRKIFELSKGGNVAGCAVTSGKLLRGKMRVVRKGDLVYEGISHTLKRFKDEVNEVRSGMECGIRLDGFDDFQEGDIIECYTQEKVAQSL